MLTGEMTRHTTFRFCLDPTVEQHQVLARHAAAALISTPRVPVKPARLTREPTFAPHPRHEPTTPEKGGAEHSAELLDTL
jgi:hypothetical protein